MAASVHDFTTTIRNDSPALRTSSTSVRLVAQYKNRANQPRLCASAHRGVPLYFCMACSYADFLITTKTLFDFLGLFSLVSLFLTILSDVEQLLFAGSGNMYTLLIQFQIFDIHGLRCLGQSGQINLNGLQ